MERLIQDLHETEPVIYTVMNRRTFRIVVNLQEEVHAELFCGNHLEDGERDWRQEIGCAVDGTRQR